LANKCRAPNFMAVGRGAAGGAPSGRHLFGNWIEREPKKCNTSINTMVKLLRGHGERGTEMINCSTASRARTSNANANNVVAVG